MSRDGRSHEELCTIGDIFACMQVYEPAKVKLMLDSLQSEATTMMLFLRNIERLEILDWQEGNAEPTLQFSCHIANVTSQLASTTPRAQAVSGTHRLNFEVATRDAPVQQHAYLVSQMKGTQTRAVTLAERASKTFGAPAIPWGAVAASIVSDAGRR